VEAWLIKHKKKASRRGSPVGFEEERVSFSLVAQIRSNLRANLCLSGLASVGGSWRKG
jgi:hypothetical protein